jgi:hypothetical protein
MEHKIITHDGKAHQDDFLGTCVCIFKLNAPAFRKKFTSEELSDPSCWILDQGRSFESELHNFDHHQLEEEICAFTMVLDHFYGKEYRKFLPQLKYVEIFDSYGPSAAAKFAEMPVDSIEIISSPVHTSMMRVFSKIDGEILNPIYSVMKEIGRDICEQIENVDLFFKILGDSRFFDYNGIKIFDVTQCEMPQGFKHDQLPTKMFCKTRGLEPQLILTKDSRQNGFRLVSINTNSIKFLQNELSYFTHNSGFLTNFFKYEDYRKIIDNYVEKF